MTIGEKRLQMRRIVWVTALDHKLAPFSLGQLDSHPYCLVLWYN